MKLLFTHYYPNITSVKPLGCKKWQNDHMDVSWMVHLPNWRINPEQAIVLGE